METQKTILQPWVAFSGANSVKFITELVDPAATDKTLVLYGPVVASDTTLLSTVAGVLVYVSFRLPLNCHQALG